MMPTMKSKIPNWISITLVQHKESWRNTSKNEVQMNNGKEAYTSLVKREMPYNRPKANENYSANWREFEVDLSTNSW